MATKPWAVALIVATTFLTSVAQMFYKIGSNYLEFNLVKIITNYYLIIGLALYVIGGILLVGALRGGEVSVLYPIFATSYIWVSFLSVIFLGEKMNFFKWVGVIIIIFGISLIGFGSKNYNTKNLPKSNF